MWDLSTLLINGQPVPEDVVVAWLNAAYHQQLGTTFGPQDSDLTTTAAGLTALLRFADAVGSRPGLLVACLRNLNQLQLAVQLGSTPVELIAGEAWAKIIHWFTEADTCTHTWYAGSMRLA
jgi:hypothetical protein